MGHFLEQTWRLRPEVNEFISTTFYEGRLEQSKACLKRSLAAGNGIRFRSSTRATERRRRRRPRRSPQGTLAEAEARENLGAVLHAEIVQPEDGPDGPLFAHFFLRVRASCAPVRVPIGRF